MSRIRTYSGENVSLIDPDPKTINMVDIAWHLAHINRFNGATRQPISVARHSIAVCMFMRESQRAHEKLAFGGLMHDAHEAYLGDMVGPLRSVAGFQRFNELTKLFDQAIFTKYGVEYDGFLVNQADRSVMSAEFVGHMTGPLPDHFEPSPSDFEYPGSVGPIRDAANFLIIAMCFIDGPELALADQAVREWLQ